MKSVFDDAFQTDPDSYTIPQVLLSKLNKALPIGMSYHDQGNGLFAAFVDDKPIEELSLAINTSAKLGGASYEIREVSDLLDYAYRTQQKVELETDEEQYIRINGNKVPLAELLIDPYDNIRIGTPKFIIEPFSFPDIDDVEIECGNFKGTFSVQRLPYDSMHEIMIKMVSRYFDGIVITMIINEKTLRGNITANVSYKEKASAEIYYQSFMFINGLVTGSLKVDGKITVNGGIWQGDKKTYDEQLWKKVVEVEKALSVQFNVSEGVHKNDILWTKRLHKSLVEHLPYEVNIEKATIAQERKDGYPEILENREAEGLFMYIQEDDIDLFVCNVRIFTVYILWRFKYHIESKEDDVVSLLLEKSVKESFACSINFLSYEEAQEFISQVNPIIDKCAADRSLIKLD